MSRMASADIMCVGPNSVKEKFTGIIRFEMFFYEAFIYSVFFTYLISFGVKSSSTMFQFFLFFYFAFS